MFRFIEKFLRRGVFGLIFLFASAILFYFINIKIPINIATLAFSFLLGWPGVLLINLFAAVTVFLL